VSAVPATMGRMTITKQLVVFDTPDLAGSSAFWAALLGGEVTRTEDDWHAVSVGGEERIAFQLAPNHVRPDWPDGQPQQIHLDLTVDDIEAAHAHALEVGAQLLQDADRSTESGFIVYADPSGHPFCLCW